MTAATPNPDQETKSAPVTLVEPTTPVAETPAPTDPHGAFAAFLKDWIDRGEHALHVDTLIARAEAWLKHVRGGA